MAIKKKHIPKLGKFFEDKPVLKAYVFGSYARSENDDESDIDILVELDYTKTIGLEFVKMQLDLQELFERKVDLLSEQAVSKYIKPEIDKDKILIYER
jgi:predicted nucleotidyltransferase